LKSTRGSYVLALLILLGLGACAGIFKFIYDRTDSVEAMVDGHAWSRTIDIEDYNPRHQEGWDETVPGDAYNQDCHTRQRGSHRVVVGQSCSRDSNGRQTCEDEYATVADYDTYCSYTVDRWQWHRNLVTEGNRRERAYWPELDFTPCPAPLFNCERESKRFDYYVVYFTMHRQGRGVETFECRIPEYDAWLSYRLEHWYTLQYGSIIPVPRCETLERREAVG
jgi:hypothetical protein